MTREEAIRHLAHLQTIGTLSDETLSAFALAEKALETENAVIDRVLEIIDKYSEAPPKMKLTSWQEGWFDGMAFIGEQVKALKGGEQG